MNILIDTHVFIWWTGDTSKLSERVVNLLNDSNNQMYLSLISIWEMQIKLSLGKLKIKRELSELVEAEIKVNSSDSLLTFH
ncbi:MAG: type II toxin-antitoxin system VapC family toxin [Sphaerospermopsis sp. SIO1G1]|nr:type II toxin-antitoxin system VapC family toxin [Sphaerospermopsis sp. SIO1G1]